MRFSRQSQPFKKQNYECVLRGRRSLRFSFFITSLFVMGSWMLMKESMFLSMSDHLQQFERKSVGTSAFSESSGDKHQLQSDDRSGASSSVVDLTTRTILQDGTVMNKSASSSSLTPTSFASVNLCTTKRDMIGGVPYVRLYQCVGPRYEAFGKALMSMVNRHGTLQYHHESNGTKKRVDADTADASNKWGQRPLPVSRPNSTILMIGNSHLRQIGVELVGQYARRYSSSQMTARMLEPPPDCAHANATLNGRPLSCGHYSKLTFLDNNSSIIFVFNTPVVYSDNWLDRLLQWLPSDFAWSDSTTAKSGTTTRSSSLDAIVWGKFNTHREDSRTSFGRDTKQLSLIMPGIDFQKYPPPRIGKIANSFGGPILAVSMFSRAYINKYNRQTKQGVANLNRSNVVYIDARRYMDELGDCGSIDPTGNIEMATSTMCIEGHKAHTCTGKYGSHADVIAWDIIEELNRLVPL